MKKSLSVILSAAMGFSMFASVAFGATQSTADFSDLKDLTPDQKAKFDALISDGTFEGTATGTFGLKEKMNRAQYAKVAAKIFALNVDANAAPTQFADVKKDDPANGYAVPFIAALAAKGLTDGYADGKYAPALEVTKEQLATFLIRGLGKEADAKTITPVVDSTVSPWATGYVALAIKLGLLSNEASGKFNGTTPATRDLLVLSASAAKAQYVAPVGAKVSVSEVKATGAKTLTVKLSQPVDTAKASLAITRGGIPVTGTTTWSADKTTATIALDLKLTDATYKVTLGGLDATAIDKASAEVVATKEQIKKIDILTASDVLPQADGVQVEFKATNQYGETTDLSATNFNIQTGNVGYTNVTGKQAIKLNLKGLSKDTTFPVTIIHTDSGVSTSKVFKVGDLPIVSKIELGDVILPSGVKNFESGSKKAYVKFTAYDQYGTKVTSVQTKDAQGNVISGLDSSRGITRVVSDTGIFDVTGFTDYDGDDQPEIELTSKPVTADKQATLTLFANGTGQSVSKTISVVAPKVPATVEFGNFTDTLAKNDINKYIPIVVKDNQGNQLSADDIVNNITNFTVYSTNSITGNVTIETAGENKGKIKLSNITDKGSATIYVGINATGKNTQMTVSIQDTRTPSVLKVTEEPATSLLYGASSEFKFKVYDQYNEELKTDQDGYQVQFALTKNNGASGTAAVINGTTVAGATYAVSDNGTAVNVPISQVFDKASNIIAGTADENVKLTAKIIKTSDASEVYSVSRQISVIKGTDSNIGLTYGVAVDGAKDNTLYAAGDKGITVSGTTYNNTNTGYVDILTGTKVAHGIKVTAKDASGNTVAVPSGQIQSAASSDSNVVLVKSVNGAATVVGNKAGTATLTVLYNSPNGTKTASINVTVKGDALAGDSITSDKTSQTVTGNAFNGKNAWDATLMNKLVVKDQYGNEFDNENTVQATVQAYNAALGIRYFISDAKTVSGNQAPTTAVSINAETGVLSGDASTLSSFTINAVAPNGKTASCTVYVK